LVIYPAIHPFLSPKVVIYILSSGGNRVTGTRVIAIGYPVPNFRLRNDLYCVEWGVKPYSLTHPVPKTGNGANHYNRALQTPTMPSYRALQTPTIPHVHKLTKLLLICNGQYKAGSPRMSCFRRNVIQKSVQVQEAKRFWNT